MSTQDDLDYEDPEDSDDSDDKYASVKVSDIRALKKAAKAAGRVNELERELAVHKAGLHTLNERQLRALAREHEGPLDPDALKATAAELGFVKLEPAVPEGEVAASDRMAAAAAGSAQPPPPNTVDFNQANTPEEVMAMAQQAGIRTVWDQ